MWIGPVMGYINWRLDHWLTEGELSITLALCGLLYAFHQYLGYIYICMFKTILRRTYILLSLRRN